MYLLEFVMEAGWFSAAPIRASQFSLRAPKGRGHRIRQQIGITTNVTSHDGGQKHIYI